MPFLPILAFFLDDETLVSAAKADDLKEKHPELADEIDALVEADPTPQKKYLQWSVGQLQAGAAVEDIIEAVKEYDKALPRLQGKDKDIGSFKTLADMQAAVEKAAAVETKGDVRKKAKKGGVVLHEDDRWMLVRPDTQEASIYYGSNTAWCVSRRDLKENYWYYYTAENNTRFYFLIDKQAKPRGVDDKGHHFSKVAMMVRRGQPLSSEPFQDAANKQPSAIIIEDVLGPFFNEMHDLALADAKKLPLNTWAFDLLYDEDLSSESFLSIYDEHKDEINNLLKDPKYESKIKNSLLYLLNEENKVIEDMFLEYCKELASLQEYTLPASGEATSPEIIILKKVADPKAMRPEVAQEVLDIFSVSKNTNLRVNVSRQKALSVEIVQRLLNDSSSIVQKTMLGNPIMLSDPELRKLAFDKAANPRTTDKTWSGLLLNQDLSVEDFKELVNQRKNTLPVGEFDDILSSLLDKFLIPATAKALGDEYSDEELDELEKKVEVLFTVTANRIGLTNSVERMIAEGKSASALRALLTHIENNTIDAPDDPSVATVYITSLLDSMARNEHLPVDAQERMLKLDKKYTIGDSSWPPIYLLARNTSSSKVINDIIALAINSLLDEVIEVTSSATAPVDYRDIIRAFKNNPYVTKDNAEFMKNFIEENKSSFSAEDLVPNSAFMQASSPILRLAASDEVPPASSGLVDVDDLPF
jgi:hypothetical protein